jgi:hypothetical protein
VDDGAENIEFGLRMLGRVPVERRRAWTSCFARRSDEHDGKFPDELSAA